MPGRGKKRPRQHQEAATMLLDASQSAPLALDKRQRDAIAGCSIGSNTPKTPVQSSHSALRLIGFEDFKVFEGVDLLSFVKHNRTTLTFPQKLMLMLAHVERNRTAYSHQDEPIVSWKTEGSAFVIRSQKAVTARILPEFFGESKFSSFTRKLYRWGFRQVLRGTNHGGKKEEKLKKKRCELVFAHKYFHRDKSSLVNNMKSTTAQSVSRIQRHNDQNGSNEGREIPHNTNPSELSERIEETPRGLSHHVSRACIAPTYPEGTPGNLAVPATEGTSGLQEADTDVRLQRNQDEREEATSSPPPVQRDATASSVVAFGDSARAALQPMRSSPSAMQRRPIRAPRPANVQPNTGGEALPNSRAEPEHGVRSTRPPRSIISQDVAELARSELHQAGSRSVLPLEVALRRAISIHDENSQQSYDDALRLHSAALDSINRLRRDDAQRIAGSLLHSRYAPVYQQQELLGGTLPPHANNLQHLHPGINYRTTLPVDASLAMQNFTARQIVDSSLGLPSSYMLPLSMVDESRLLRTGDSMGVGDIARHATIAAAPSSQSVADSLRLRQALLRYSLGRY